jgi:hypothetical protein
MIEIGIIIFLVGCIVWLVVKMRRGVVDSHWRPWMQRGA